MRQKIEKFANGIFSYEKPALMVSESTLELKAIAGKETVGSFVVSNDRHTKVRGFCLCKSEFISFRDEIFEETENEVTVIFNAANLEPQSRLNSVIEIITECGEYTLPLDLEVTASYIETSIGQTSDLFHFANLAISNPQEAKDLFKTEDFKNIVIGNAPEYRNIYRNLSGSANTSLVLEEFLIAAKKKTSMEFSINASKLVYEAGDTPVVDKILIRKNNWGYSQLKCEADGAFIEPERTLIWTEDFENNEFWLKFAINPEKARFGNNYGCIRIATLADEVEIPVLLFKASPFDKEKKAEHRKREFQIGLLKNHLDYFLERIDEETYVTEAENCLDPLKAFRPESDFVKLYRLYLKYLSGKQDEAVKEYDLIEDTVRDSDNIYIYSMALFMGALLKDNKPSGEYCSDLRRAYENEHELFSLLLYLKVDDRERFSKRQRFEEIKNCYLEGDHSVFGLIEGIKLLSIDPLLLKELSEVRSGK